MRINDDGLAIIKEFERCELVPFLDPRNIPTQAWGHTQGVTLSSPPCTQEQADAWLEEDVAAAEAAVSRMVTTPLNENQFSALVSLVYNIGAGAFHGSTMRHLLICKDYPAAAEEFGRWVYAGGNKLPGLVARRAAEKALFLKPVNKAVNT